MPLLSPCTIGVRSAEQESVGGRFGRGSTRISPEQSAVPPFPSSTRTLTVYVPGAMSEEFHRASELVPSTVPPLAVQEYVRGLLSGSLASARTVTVSPEPA